MSAAWPIRPAWIFPLVYLVHLLDERFFGAGTAAWSTTHAGIDFTNEAWLVVNVLSFALFAGVAFAADRGRLPDWVFVTLASHLLLHGGMHVAGTLARPEPFPGVVSSALFNVPFALFVFLGGARFLDRRVWLGAAALGLATMQPIYHSLFRFLRPELLGGTP